MSGDKTQSTLNLDETLLDNAGSLNRELSLRQHKGELSKAAQEAMTDWKPIGSTGSFQKARFQVVDFFSGCGGMSLGFAATAKVYPSFQLVGGCDIDRDACCSYRRNFDVPCLETDVRSLEDDTALADFMKKLDRYQRSKPLIVIGCPPCQGFTSHRKRKWEAKDQRNELVVVFARVCAKLGPACVIMENVPEMLSHKYLDYFREFRKTLESVGYVVHQSIFNAAAFGVPQERFRAIVVAMKHDFLLPKPMLSSSKEYPTVGQAIGDLPRLAAGERSAQDVLHRAVRHNRRTLETIHAIPKDGGSRPIGVGPKCLDRIKGFSDVYGRLSWDKPAITITHYARNPASGRYVHPEQNRGLTMREVASLQSFPNGFVFCGSIDSIYKQIGEAVPPKMACAVAVNALVELCSPPPTDGEKQDGIASIDEPVNNSFSSVIAKLKQAGVGK